MATRTKATFAPTIADLAPSFRRSLEAQNRSPKTLIAYSEAMRLLDGFLAAQGMPREAEEDFTLPVSWKDGACFPDNDIGTLSYFEDKAEAMNLRP